MCSTTSQVLIDRYLKGRDILLTSPSFRQEDELAFLQEWLPENIPVFRETTTKSIRSMAESMTLQSHFAGEVIYEQDEPVYHFHVILRGSVSLLVDPNFQRALHANTATSSLDVARDARRPSRVVKRESSRHPYGKEVNRLLSGDHFGEKALLQKEERAPHTIRANEKVELVSIHVSIFNKHLYSHFQEAMMRRAGFLAGLEWLKNWTPQLLRQLTFALQERRHRFGDCLYRQEMSVPGILFIQSGSVRVSTHRNKKPPEELVSKIEPPKDYLPEILAENDAQQQGVGDASGNVNNSKVSLFSSGSSKQLIGVDSQQTLLPATPGSSRFASASSSARARRGAKANAAQAYGAPTNTTTATQLPGRPPQRPAVSLSGKQRSSRERREVVRGRQLMGFVIHHPSPVTSANICILGPGDTLCDLEGICKLKRHLFNAVCESDVIVYELDRLHFELMFEKRVPHTLYQLTCRGMQRVDSWGAQHPGVHIFKPLSTVLEQVERRMVEGGTHRLGRRRRPLYVTPGSLAFTAIIGLGRPPPADVSIMRKQMSLELAPPQKQQQQQQQTPDIQVETLPLPPLTPPLSAATVASSPDQPPPAFPASPFEPRITDFERMAMLYNSHRKGCRNERGLFDSPAPVVRRRNSGTVLAQDVRNIPVPMAYSVRSASPPDVKVAVRSLPSKEEGEEEKRGIESPMPVQGASRKRDLVISMGEIFAAANEPQCLSKIRLGILFGKKQLGPTGLPHQGPQGRMKTSSAPAIAASSSSSSSATFARNRVTSFGTGMGTGSQESRVRTWRSKSARIAASMRTPSISSTLRSISFSYFDTSPSMEDVIEEEASKVHKNMRPSFSVDNEITSIPKEYSSLFKTGEEGEGGGRRGEEEEGEEADECSGSGQGSSRSHCMSCPPFVKTMEHVIENRTSYMLTRYRLSLAISGAAGHKKATELHAYGRGAGNRRKSSHAHHIN